MLRQAKVSATNDFVAYRRALRGAGVEPTEEVEDIVSGLQEFLVSGGGGGGGGDGGGQSPAAAGAAAASWGGVARLLAGMSRTPGAEDVVAACVQHALDVITEATRTGAGIGVLNGLSSFFSSPSKNSAAAMAAGADPAATVPIPLLFPERFSLLRALGVALSCLVGPGAEPSQTLQTLAGKKLFESGIKVMRRWPVVPLMGDVQVTPLSLLRVLRGVRGNKELTAIVDAAGVSKAQAEQLRASHAPAVSLPVLTDAARSFLGRFSAATAAAAAAGSVDPSTRGTLHLFTLEGLGVMSALGGAIATQAALNFAYPAGAGLEAGVGAGAGAAMRYERAVRASHSAADRAALLDAIDALKAVDAEMAARDASLAAPALLALAKSSMRSFAMDTMAHMIKSATKHQRPVAKTLNSLREAMTASPEPTTAAGYVVDRLHVLRAAVGEMLVGAGGAPAKSLFNRSADFSTTSLKELAAVGAREQFANQVKRSAVATPNTCELAF